ncbi:MAG: hypothetical protein EOP83_33175 [Verrucomicrobiaceae bacterium]|nr:MAG: hypothetical protein EOP83_33175 [Verrucomicrobiaceae bacterium]
MSKTLTNVTIDDLRVLDELIGSIRALQDAREVVRSERNAALLKLNFAEASRLSRDVSDYTVQIAKKREHLPNETIYFMGQPVSVI